MPLPESVSIVMRSKNDAPLIGATLRGVRAQSFPGRVELVHIDSGSTDDTLGIIRSFEPAKLIQIQPHEYVPGLVLNRGMRETSAPWVVFLNSDCEPLDERWLAELLAVALSSPKTGAAFGRQIPRPNCQAVYAHDYERCFGLERESKQWDHFFSMANSVVRREAWSEQPFREDLQYSEDDEWSRRLIKNGWKIAYAEAAAVIHSHNYTLREAHRRSYGEAFALAALEGVREGHYGFLRTVVAGGARQAMGDFRYCLRERRGAEWPRALTVRIAQRLGKLHGFRDGWRRRRAAAIP
jgi:rhamnosyltransferase